MAKVLFVSSGQRSGRPLTNIPGFTVETTGPENLRMLNLWGYLAVVIGSWTSEQSLIRSTAKLKAFVERGGVLVCLGCQASEAEWIPFCQWVGIEPAKATWSQKGENFEKVFNGIDVEFLKFHEFWGHGGLHAPRGADVLARGDGIPMMCVVEGERTKGAALISTIDPDFHAQTGIRTLDKTNQEEKQEAARQFLENTLHWCESKRRDLHSPFQRFIRSVIGFFRLRWVYAVLALALWPLTVWIGLVSFLEEPSFSFTTTVPAIASVGGLALVITDRYLQSRRTRG